MTMSNSNVAESRLSCHTTSFAVCDWHLLVSYRTLARLSRGLSAQGRLAGKIHPQHFLLVLFTFTVATKHQSLR